MRDVLIGQTDYTVLVRVASTTGAPVTGLANTDIDIAYARVETDNDVTTSDVSPASLSALTDAHSDWGWKEVSSTDHPGLYRLDVADAVFASGAWESVVTVTDASGTDFYAIDIGFRLVSFNVQDGVRMGLTALPNAAAEAAGGLVTNGTSTGQLSVSGGRAKADTIYWNAAAVATPTVAGVPEVDITHISGVAEDLATETDVVDSILDEVLAGSHDVAGSLGALVPAISTQQGTRFDGVDDNLDTIIDQTLPANIGAAILDLADAVETGVTVRKLFRLLAALGGGKTTSDGAVYRNINDSKNVITSTITDGDRASVTLDLT